MHSGIKCPDISNPFLGACFIKEKQQTLKQKIINQGTSTAFSQQPWTCPTKQPTFLPAPPGSWPQSPQQQPQGKASTAPAPLLWDVSKPATIALRWERTKAPDTWASGAVN